MAETKKRSRVGIPTRFKFMRIILIVMMLSFLLNTYMILQLFDKAPETAGASINPFFIFQTNFIAIMMVLVITLVWILHYGFGALSRMENILEQVLNGDYSFRMHLRKRDMMRPFADKMNKVLDLLEKNKK